MATSKLQRTTSKRLFKKYGKYGLIENTRPVWLVSSKGERLELDFYIPKLHVAVEVQGLQHFEFTPMFHDCEYDFIEQLRRDKEKIYICSKAGIELFYICSQGEINEAVYAIDKRIAQRLTEKTKPQWTHRKYTRDYPVSKMYKYNNRIDHTLILLCRYLNGNEINPSIYNKILCHYNYICEYVHRLDQVDLRTVAVARAILEKYKTA